MSRAARPSSRRVVSLAAAAFLVAGFAAPASLAPVASAGDEPDYAAILEQRSPAVVTLKYVLKIRASQGGQSGDQERNAEARGVVVDASGLVMLSNDALEGGAGLFRQMFSRRAGGGGGGDVSVTPADIKVLFGADAKEHDAVLVARDTKLGLAFVKILEPEGALAAIDLTKGAECKVGQMLVGVTRKSRGFDSAAVFERAIVTGRVEKPRTMFALSGGVAQGLPLYDAKGLPVGVAARQQGVEGADEGAGPFSMGQSEVFLLPLDLVQRTLAQAKSRVDEAVKKAKESREKASGSGEKPSEPAMDGATPATPTTPETPRSPDSPKVPEVPKSPDAPKTPDAPK